MDVGTVSALNLYTFQNTAQSSGRTSAVLQALGQIYDQSSAAAGSDPASQLLTTASLAPVVNAMAALTSTDGSGSLSAESLQAYTSYGGLSTASASILFSSGSTPEASQGFDSALGASSTLALTAYQVGLSYGSSAKAELSPIQQVTQAAQASSSAATLNLLG